MRKRNNIFAEAFRWIKKNMEGIKYQKDLAARIGVSEDTITRIMRDQTEVTDDFLCKFNEAFGNIFNYQWLRGEDDAHMLASELNSNNLHQSAPVIDASSATNAAIAAYVELTNRLKQEMAERLEDKEAIIREKDARIIALERTIADRDARIIVLERQIAAYHADDLSNYPFSVGVADKLVPQNNKKI